MNVKINPVTVIFFGVLLSGCSIQRINSVMNKAEADRNEAVKKMDEMPPATYLRPTIKVHEKSEKWANPIPIKNNFKLKDNCPKMITYTKSNVDVFQFAQNITEMCGVPVRVSPDVMLSMSVSSESAGDTRQLSSSAIPSPVIDNNGMQSLQSLQSLQSSGVRSARASSTSVPSINRISFEGDRLSSLLDVAVAKMGLSWKEEDNRIVIYYLETKIFYIDALDSKVKLLSNVKSGISAQSGATSSSGASSSNTGVSGDSGSSSHADFQINNDLYGNIQETASSLLSPPPIGKLAMNKTSGAIVVTDIPEKLKIIERYLTDENESFNRPVKLSVRIYTVQLEKNEDGAINWGLVYKSLGKYGVTLSNAYSANTSDISAGFTVLDSSSSRFAGTDVMFKALSEQVNVSNVSNNNILTTNMAARTFQIGSQVTYLQSTSTSQTSNVGTTESLNPGSVTTGTNITVLPKITKGDDKMMLSFVMDLSTLKQLRRINGSTSNNLIEAPNIDTNGITQRVWLKNNETIVISGFDQEENSGTKQGVGDPNNVVFGGGMTGSNKKKTFVITITPSFS
ncbi:PilN family type IVB pilus formation outer membrane protein [Dickeya dadantii]|uniref:PilN family type IVB pilus formation outer membrane protein n=1 Tax=Dickeya dadantii TaxID=204038 RepID=UPI001495D243|nr:PilN family type IVB pilus formation outer membrane protein [Dickeya dadantii]NPE55924.1 PilN family type IVB pilus formation outer membrane protein [Dickeya dadantii]NPE67148.1 PilN family type IVB pilus formation outer membrane protein [Dickeya dadantii]